MRLGILGVCVLLFPLLAFAFPFGGQIGTIVPCYNNAIYANLGPPIGGPYIWTPSTRTYQFGPPRASGQWLLGLASAPYYCVVSIDPVIVWPGTHIDMMGSSGPSSPSRPTTDTNFGLGTGLGSGSGTAPSPLPGSSTSNTGRIGNVVISEVFHTVDSVHGTDPQNEWIELYNGALTPISLAGWSLSNSSSGAAITIPGDVIIPAGKFAILTSSSLTKSKWSIPADAQVILISSPIGGGLARAGDAVFLKGSTKNTIVDSVSWGSNTTAFTPAAPSVQSGHSVGRKTLSQDTNTASDWADIVTPTPGR